MNELEWETVNFASGQWSETSEKFSINYSSILTLLIKKAGSLCERYSSDLFIDWFKIIESLKNEELENTEYMFGFRENGVDHKDFIDLRLKSNEEEKYKELYKLKIRVITRNHAFYTHKDIEFELFKCTNLEDMI